MTILKRTLAFLCASLLCVSLAACNSGTDETGETKDTAPAVETNAPDTAADTETEAPETTPPETEPAETKPAPVELDPLPAADALAAMSDEEYFGSYFRPVIRFVAASDVHIDDSNSDAEEERLANLYKTAYAYSDAHESYKALDAVFFAGDFTNYGTLFHEEVRQDRGQERPGLHPYPCFPRQPRILQRRRYHHRSQYVRSSWL